MTDSLPTNNDARLILRHALATLAYRAAKALRDAPQDFAVRSFGGSTRLPVKIVAHMADLMAWGISLARGDYFWSAEGSDDWGREVDRFFGNLAKLDELLAVPDPFPGSMERIIQGPLTDALTHVGQLAMLRGVSGSPIRPESYARATISVGRVGMDQEAPGKEFDGDASDPE